MRNNWVPEPLQNGIPSTGGCATIGSQNHSRMEFHPQGDAQQLGPRTTPEWNSIHRGMRNNWVPEPLQNGIPSTGGCATMGSQNHSRMEFHPQGDAQQWGPRTT